MPCIQGDHILVRKQNIKYINKYIKMIICATDKCYIKDKVVGRDGVGCSLRRWHVN